MSENQTICLEDLNIEGMMKNHCLAGSISDASWKTFVDMLKYKADWQGKSALFIGKFSPSSKTCSCCGWIKRDLELKDRQWTCKSCNVQHDRDVNAANNIKAFALKKHFSGTERKNHGELPTLVGVMTREAHSSVLAVGG